MKKVRLTVKLVLSESFKKIIEKEERSSGIVPSRVVTKTSGGSSLMSSAKMPTQVDSEESKFDKDDLVLKSSSDAMDHMINYLSKDELALDFGAGGHSSVIEEDPNFQISHLLPDDDVDEDEDDLEEPQLEFLPDVDPILQMMGVNVVKASSTSEMNTSGTDPYLLQLMSEVNRSSSEDGNISLPLHQDYSADFLTQMMEKSTLTKKQTDDS